MIKSMLLDGCETWRVTERSRRALEAAQMDAIRRSMRISRRGRIRNGEIKQQMGVEGSIVDDIKKKNNWFGMDMCREWRKVGSRNRQWNG